MKFIYYFLFPFLLLINSNVDAQCTYDLNFNNCKLEVVESSGADCTTEFVFNLCDLSVKEIDGLLRIGGNGQSFVSSFDKISNYANFSLFKSDYNINYDGCCVMSSLSGGGSSEVDADTLTYSVAENYGVVANSSGNLVQGGIYVSNSFLNGNTRIGGLAGNDAMGVYNSAFGYTALKDALSTARDNVGIGYQSLEEVNEDGNVAIGAQALNELTTGSNNVAIGYRAGYNQFLTNNDNTIIGSNSTVAGNSSTNELVIGANLVGQGDSTVNIGYDPTDKYLKAYLPDTIQTEIITNAAGDVIDVSAGGGGGSSKATFLFNGAFFNSTVPAPDFYLPITSEGEGNSIQRSNTIIIPVTAQLKKVVIALTGTATLADGDITVDFQERNTSTSGASSIESQTVAYTEDISEVNNDSIYEFTFTSSAVASPGRPLYLHISGTFTGDDWGNLVWSAYFEEI